MVRIRKPINVLFVGCITSNQPALGLALPSNIRSKFPQKSLTSYTINILAYCVQSNSVINSKKFPNHLLVQPWYSEPLSKRTFLVVQSWTLHCFLICNINFSKKKLYGVVQKMISRAIGERVTYFMTSVYISYDGG